MSIAETSRICCVCRRIFCCVQCRLRHEKNKHPGRQLNCPLCSSQKLPLQFFNDKSLLCHIVITHLPLYCCLCGENFKQSKDLESFGICKWWQARRRSSLISDMKSLPGTPPLVQEGKGTETSINNGYNGNFDSLTSPPELYRNTSTPMVVGQKTSFDFKTPNVPNFVLKTPKTNSATSTKSQLRSFETTNSKNESHSNYVSFPSTNYGETPLRSIASNNDPNSDHFVSSESGRKLDNMKEEDENDENICSSKNQSEDMELTNVVGEILPDSQNLEITSAKVERKSDSIKRVRFSDQYESHVEPNATGVSNMTESEEFFEAHETMPNTRESMENSQIKIYEKSITNIEKENRSTDGNNVVLNQQSSGSRVLMMVVMENNSATSTSDLISSGLKKLEKMSTGACASIPRNDSSDCSSSIASVNSYCSVSSYEYYAASNSIDSTNEESRSTLESNENAKPGGILSAFAHAVRSVMKNFSGAGTSKSNAREEISQREDIVLRATTSETSNAMSNFTASLARRSAKRPRDTTESTSSLSRQGDHAITQVEVRSPLAKRHRGWYKIRAREPLARMRENRVTSPRGISSETQVFSQGSLSVGNTVLPLPARAHQSTQTE